MFKLVNKMIENTKPDTKYLTLQEIPDELECSYSNRIVDHSLPEKGMLPMRMK